MKLHNFTIRGNCLKIVGRIVRKGDKSVPVYDIEFPDSMDGMSIEELTDAIRRIEEDINDLFYYDKNIRNDSLFRFEKSWREEAKTMRTELEQERRMSASDRFGDVAGETARRLEDMKRLRKREQKAWEENNNGQEE